MWLFDERKIEIDEINEICRDESDNDDDLYSSCMWDMFEMSLIVIMICMWDVFKCEFNKWTSAKSKAKQTIIQTRKKLS